MAKEHFLTGAGEGKANAVRAEEGQVQVYDERGRKTEAPKGSGITLNVGTPQEHTLTTEEFAKLAGTDPELHRQLSATRQGGNTREVPTEGISQPDVKPIHTKEAGQVVNEMHKVLQAHIGSMRSSSSPRADKLADNPVASEIHGKASQSLSEARDLITEGDSARRGRLDPTTNTVMPDQDVANQKYKAAFSKLKDAHGWANHPGLTQAGVESSPINEGAMKAISSRFSHKDSLPSMNKRKSSKAVVVGNTAHFIHDGGESAHDPKEVAKARAAGLDVRFLSESEARDEQRRLDAGVKAGLPRAGADKFRRRVTGKVNKKEVREGTRSPQIGFAPGQDPSKKTPKNRVIEDRPRLQAATTPGVMAEANVERPALGAVVRSKRGKSFAPTEAPTTSLPAEEKNTRTEAKATIYKRGSGKMK